jgi:transcriptional regulator with XRE-family HTH domain
MTNPFGNWLKTSRMVTIDPVTGRPYSQARLAQALGVSAGKVASWESGKIVSVSPRDASGLARVLNRSQAEILQTMGYHLDLSLAHEELELVSVFRQLPPLQRQVEKERLRILLGLLRQSGQLEENV